MRAQRMPLAEDKNFKIVWVFFPCQSAGRKSWHMFKSAVACWSTWQFFCPLWSGGSSRAGWQSSLQEFPAPCCSQFTPCTAGLLLQQPQPRAAARRCDASPLPWSLVVSWEASTEALLTAAVALQPLIPSGCSLSCGQQTRWALLCQQEWDGMECTTDY